MSPVPRVSHADALNPVHLHAARCAVEDPGCEVPFQIGLHLQELEAEHLRVNGDRMIASTGSLASSTSSSALTACSATVRTAPEDLSFSARHVLEVKTSPQPPGGLEEGVAIWPDADTLGGAHTARERSPAAHGQGLHNPRDRAEARCKPQDRAVSCSTGVWVAPGVGLEPTTYGLTVRRSAN